MNCIKDGKYTGDSCFGCIVKVEDCDIKSMVYKKRWTTTRETISKVKVNGVSITHEGSVGNCPSCKRFIRRIENEYFCLYCGQNIDWRSEE